MAEIVLHDIEKFFGDNYVIRKLNLTIKNREFVVLLGPPGCGEAAPELLDHLGRERNRVASGFFGRWWDAVRRFFRISNGRAVRSATRLGRNLPITVGGEGKSGQDYQCEQRYAHEGLQ